MRTLVSKDMMDARLEIIETRMDARVTRIEEMTDVIVVSLKDTQASIKSLKETVIITAISSVLAIVLGVAAFNATVLSNMVASFESGRHISATEAQVMQQIKDVQALLDQVKKQHPAP